jgi:tRNA threonylcarbamoyladenosine biosynthesis protein TsaB
MYVLALDTTTRDGSVALVTDDRTIEVRRGDANHSQAERLPGELLDVASTHHVGIGAVDLFAVAAGPGSFTGLRIGIATMQGLALTSGRRIVAVSALDALAQTVAEDAIPGTFVAAWMDARRRDVFAALYQVTDAAAFSPERVIEVDHATAAGPDATLDRWAARIGTERAMFVGDGAIQYAGTIDRRAVATWTVLVEVPLLAGTIGRMAVAAARRGATIDPAAIQPMYVRRPDVEMERERRALTDAS